MEISVGAEVHQRRNFMQRDPPPPNIKGTLCCRMYGRDFVLSCRTIHLRLKWDKVLLVLVVHFARYDVGDIHYCGEKQDERVETFSRHAEHRVAVTYR